MIIRIFKHPIFACIAIFAGILLGIYAPSTAKELSGIGDAYLLLIRMTIVPILVSAIISSMGQFIQNPSFPSIAARAWKTVLLILLSIAILSLSLGAVLKPGRLTQTGADFLSRYIGTQTDVLILSLDDSGTASADSKNFINIFVQTIVPENLFYALVEGQTLSLAFVSIIFGIAAGLLQQRRQKMHKLKLKSILITLCENTFAVFQLIINAVLIFLPFALVFIVANLIAENGAEVFLATIRLLVTFYILALIIILAGSITLAIVAKKPLFKIFRTSLAPASLGFMTRNSIATIPSSIENLAQGCGLNTKLSKLLTPLFFVLCRYGNLAYFGLVVMFSAQIYQIDLSIVELTVVILSLIFASVATAGATGFATLSVISIAFLPLGIPVETMLVILYAIDPIVDPIRTAVIVHTNFCAVGIIGSNSNFEQQPVAVQK